MPENEPKEGQTLPTESKPIFFGPLSSLGQLVRARLEEREDYKHNVVARANGRLMTTEELRQARDDASILIGDDAVAFIDRHIEALEAILGDFARGAEAYAKREDRSELVALLEELASWEASSFMINIDDADETGLHKRIAITGPVDHFITEKYEVLSQLYAATIKCLWGYRVEEMKPLGECTLSAAQRTKLEFLNRLFEDGASKYPGSTHSVMSWPFLNLMPRPPEDIFPDFEFPKRRGMGFLLMEVVQRPCVTAKTLTHHWSEHQSEEGSRRFASLASEAGEIAAEVMFDEENRLAGDREKSGSGSLAFNGFIRVWLDIIHETRNTLVRDDGWSELFNEDSDFSEQGFREGSYNVWRSEDIFLDSAFVCQMLLMQEVTDEKPTAAGPSKVNGLSPSILRAYKSYEWVATNRPELVPSEGSRSWYTRAMHEVAIDKSGVYDEKDGPSYETWATYLRKYKLVVDGPKNTPRAGREIGSRSIAKKDQV